MCTTQHSETFGPNSFQIYKRDTEFELRNSSKDNRGLTKQELANQICIFASLKTLPSLGLDESWNERKFGQKCQCDLQKETLGLFFLSFLSTLFDKSLNAG